MSIRMVPPALVVPVLFLFALNLALAGEIRDVTIVRAGDGKVTLMTPKGSEHTVDVARDARITCDGRACRLEDLRQGYKANVTGERVNDQKLITAIEARSK